MFSRTYSPLPGWAIPALAVAWFLAPGRHLRLSLGILAAGHVIGPAVARLIVVARAVDDNLTELPDCEDTTIEGVTP